jgi:hypothetical protein
MGTLARNIRASLLAASGTAGFICCAALAADDPRIVLPGKAAVPQNIDEPITIVPFVVPNGVDPPMRVFLGGDGRLVVVQGEQLKIDLPIVSAGFANDQDLTGPITPLIKALEDASYQQRKIASEALMRLPPGRLNEVVEALQKEKDEEAVARLTEVAAHLYLKPRTYLKARTSVLGVWNNHRDPSLLGIRYQPDKVKIGSDEKETMTVMVTELQPGFPAMQTFRAGDRIVAINGEGFPPEMPDGAFRERIAGLWPGSVTPMVVLRDGKLVELGVQTTCVPISDSLPAELMIEQRNASLAAFLESLKRPKDQTSARADFPPASK